MSSLPPENYETTHAEQFVTVKAKLLSDVPTLLAWSAQHPSGFVAQPALTYSTGPWSKETSRALFPAERLPPLRALQAPAEARGAGTGH